MGGRGRGGGRGMSFALEQIGIAKGEALPAPVMTPPPHYPLLEHYPAIMAPGPIHHAMLSYRTNLLEHFSRYANILTTQGPDRRSSHPTEQPFSDVQLEFDWTRFPFELRPNLTKKRKSTSEAKPSKEKVQKIKNFDAVLDELEKKEEVRVKKELDEDVGGNEEEEMEDEDDGDEEMDEGTDYNQNYFDNGEGFLDEDDDGDDSPVY